VRGMGRTAGGVRGIRLQEGQEVIALIIMDGGDILTAAETGYGKRTKPEDFPAHGRGGQGVIAMQTSERNGALVSAVQVNDDDEVMLITDGGVLIRTSVEGISVLSRNTQGVRLIKVGPKEKLIGVAPVAKLDDVDENEYVEGVDGAEAPDEPLTDEVPEEGGDEGVEE
jgi:DNA gyrase subunit A